MAEMKWEELHHTGLYGGLHGKLKRAKVPGGWLVLFTDVFHDGGGAGGLTFLPDPLHQWDGSSLPLEEPKKPA